MVPFEDLERNYSVLRIGLYEEGHLNKFSEGELLSRKEIENEPESMSFGRFSSMYSINFF